MNDRYSIALALAVTGSVAWLLRVVVVWWQVALVALVVFLIAEHVIERGMILPPKRGKTVGMVVVTVILIWGLEIGGIFHPNPNKIPSYRVSTPQGTYHVTVCKDGWVSPSQGRGTCSWHGGVDR